jgi:hypothetical protein
MPTVTAATMTAATTAMRIIVLLRPVLAGDRADDSGGRSVSVMALRVIAPRQ